MCRIFCEYYLYFVNITYILAGALDQYCHVFNYSCYILLISIHFRRGYIMYARTQATKRKPGVDEPVPQHVHPVRELEVCFKVFHPLL